jgi:solute carrier family 13 (sodium-dependent dicarboxylate transporter), member 2/3/5
MRPLRACIERRGRSRFKKLALPLVLFPLLGVAAIPAAAAPYANPIVFLFLGGFILVLAMQRWGLHRRVALALVGRFGLQPARIVGGFLLASALISMWVSNTGTALMMLPIATSVVSLVPDMSTL